MFYKEVTLFLQLCILDQHNLQLSSKTHTQKSYVDKTVKAYGPEIEAKKKVLANTFNSNHFAANRGN